MATRRNTSTLSNKSEWHHYNKKCPNCGGTGLVTIGMPYGEADVPCNLCKRSGYVEMKAPNREAFDKMVKRLSNYAEENPLSSIWKNKN